jgi:type II secretory pathway component PulK
VTINLFSFRRQSRLCETADCAAISLALDRRRSAFVLVAVLVVVTLLGLAAYQYSEMMTAEFKAADSAMRAAQARALAASGVNYAAALLSNKDSFTGTLGSNPYDNSGVFQGQNVGNSDNPRYQGRFSIVAPLNPDETENGATGFRYGATDESSKININAMMQLDPSGKTLHDALMKLPNMTEDVADAIVDWVDPDDDPRPSGAESSYYTGLSPSYRCKNGPLDSIEELLLVRGVTPELLFGSDRNRNGVTDPGEADDGAQPNDRGWSVYLTVYSRERNVDSDNNPRTYLNDSDINKTYDALSSALTVELADFILAYRLYGPYTPQSSGSGGGAGSGGSSSGSGSGASSGGASSGAGSSSGGGGSSGSSSGSGSGGGQNQDIVINSGTPVQKSQLDMSRRPQAISSIFALVNAKVGISQQSVTLTQRVTVGPGGGVATVTSGSTTTRTTVYNSPLSDQGKLQQFLPILLDKFTTRKDAEIPARINVNTAPPAVVATLPGLDDTDVQNIVSNRPNISTGDAADPIYSTPAWLLTQANLSPTKLQAIERYVSASSQVYRVQSLGYFEKGGPVARIEAVIDTNAGQPRIVFWRDISELGKAFDIQK